MGFWDIAKKIGEGLLETAQKEAAKNQKLKQQIMQQRERAAATTPAYQPGKPGNKTAIVLSAPGSAEEKAGKPAAGQTGKTLNKFLEQANKKDPKRFPSKNKDDYTIVNASDEVHFKAKTGRTEAMDKKILDKANLSRVTKALKEKDTVVALGSKAAKVADKVAADKTVLKGDHPSMQSVNRKYKSDKATPADRGTDRLKQYANDVLKTPKKK